MKSLARSSSVSKRLSFARTGPSTVRIAPAADQALRCVAVGYRNDSFAGSERRGERAFVFYSLSGLAKLNGLAPEAHSKLPTEESMESQEPDMSCDEHRFLALSWLLSGCRSSSHQ